MILVLKYKLSGAPGVNKLEYISCSIQRFLRPWKQRSSPQLAPLPPTFAVFCFFLFSRKTGRELTVGILSLMPLSVGLGATVDAKLFLARQRNERNLQEPSFRQWPKWPPIHLQNVNWRCHGNRTTLPGSVKIHLYLRLGRGQKGKKRQLQGENRDGGLGGRLYSALQRWRNPLESKSPPFISSNSS